MDEKVRDFARKLKQNFKIQKLILFGSRATGDYLKTSDYDFIIVSEDFRKYDFLKRISTVIEKCKTYFGADILCYTPEEFENKRKQIGIVSSALKEGISIIG